MNTFKLVSRDETNEFNSNSENRVINHGHVNKIKEQMKTSLNVMPPITINDITKNIIDGQHRLKAFQKLVDDGELPLDSRLPVMFVTISTDFEKEAIINANTNSKNWSLDDYIASYAKSNHIYKQLDEWCSNHALTVDGNKKKISLWCINFERSCLFQAIKRGFFFINFR